MHQTKKRVSPGVEMVESRVLPSAAPVLISTAMLKSVAREVRAIMVNLAATGNVTQAGAELAHLSTRIPSGPEGLAPTWQADLALYRPHRAASVTLVQRRILGDLSQFVQSGTVTGPIGTTSPSPGQGGGCPILPAPLASLDSVTIQNTTGLALRVTVHLQVPQVQKPYISKVIPAQGQTSALFNFGTATNAFMTIDVSRADGGQSPPPLNGVSLDQPMNGYNGTPFTVSIFGSYFNISSG